jgi:Lhr-like helicase
VNTAIDDCSISKLRAVVLDELHMVDDDHRGYLLELVATKLLSLEQRVQIVGMSATLPVCWSVDFVVHFEPSNLVLEYGHDGSMARRALLRNSVSTGSYRGASRV